MPTPRRLAQPTVTPADVEAAIKARFDALNQPGGALYVLAFEAAERRGRDRVYRWMGRAAWAVVLLVLGYGLNHFSAQRNEETRKTHVRESARVEEKLQKVEEVTKALAPEAFLTSKIGK